MKVTKKISAAIFALAVFSIMTGPTIVSADQIMQSYSWDGYTPHYWSANLNVCSWAQSKYADYSRDMYKIHMEPCYGWRVADGEICIGLINNCPALSHIECDIYGITRTNFQFILDESIFMMQSNFQYEIISGTLDSVTLYNDNGMRGISLLGPDEYQVRVSLYFCPRSEGPFGSPIFYIGHPARITLTLDVIGIQFIHYEFSGTVIRWFAIHLIDPPTNPDVSAH